MTRPHPSSASWGDLLRFLALPGAAESSADASSLLGLPKVELPPRTEQATKRSTTPEPEFKPQPQAEKATSTTFRLPLRCPQGFTVRIDATPRPLTEPMLLPDWGREEAAAVDRMLDRSDQPPPSPHILLDRGRLQARWRRALRKPCGSTLDLERMVQTLALSEWPAPLPQQARANRLQDVHVCIDLHPDRQFLLHDVLDCLRLLHTRYPGIRRHIHVIEGAHSCASLFAAVAPGQTVLLLAESRLMSQADLCMWQHIQACLIAQSASVYWSLDWLPAAWTAPSAQDDPLQLAPKAPAVSENVLGRLLACLAMAVTVEAALVRALIDALKLPGGLALEQAVWRHPDLDGAWPFRQWFPARQKHHLEQLRQLSSATLEACGRVLLAWHVHRSQVERDEELLSWADVAGSALIARLCGVSVLDDAKLRYARVAKHLLQLRSHADAVGLAGTSSPGVIRAAAMERWRSLPDCLGADRKYVEGLLLQAAEPHGVGSSIGTSDREDAHVPLSAWLFQQGQRLLLVPIDFVGPGVYMISLNIDRRRLIVECDGVSRVVWRPREAMAQAPLVLVEWERIPPKNVRVRGTIGELRVDRVERPHWAAQFALQPAWAGLWVTDRSGMGWGTDGLFHWPDGNPVAMEPSAPHGVVYSTPNGWQFEIDRYGPRLSYVVSTKFSHDALRVYFRYIPPGTYLQGSPGGIGDNDEHPQHAVTLSQGLWLAETLCTQALWQVVMGKNPSMFKKGADAARWPVENVSWDDVQIFLKTMQPLLPSGCQAVLPTESQWEYACRAGTQTEYWWGDAPDERKANYEVIGERKRGAGTTPVDRYSPNPWGLYDMHGNLWEWCADGQRDYTDIPARNPEGPSHDVGRVVRGGSWTFHPGNARAAYRLRRLCGDANQYRGFRFALRSSSGLDAPMVRPPRRDADDASTAE